MIRLATIKDLPKLSNIAEQFYSSSETLDDFDIEVFVLNWQKIIETKIGILLLLINEGNIVGVLGGIKYQDVNSENLIASELFWFVEKEHRGQGSELLELFEKWAKINKCKKIIMVHLADLMPDRLEVFYRRKGYRKMEVHYVKEVL